MVNDIQQIKKLLSLQQQ